MSKNIIFEQPLQIQQESCESDASLNEMISYDSILQNDQSSDDDYQQILSEKDQQIFLNQQKQKKRKHGIFQNLQSEKKSESFRINQIKNFKENNFKIFFQFVQSDHIDTFENNKVILRNYNQFIQPINSFTNLIQNVKDHRIQIKIINGVNNISIGIVPFKIQSEPLYNKQITSNLNWLAYDFSQNVIVQNGKKSNYGCKLENEDVLDIQFFPKIQEVHFAKNMVPQGIAFQNVFFSQYHLIICLKKPDDSVKIISHKEI